MRSRSRTLATAIALSVLLGLSTKYISHQSNDSAYTHGMTALQAQKPDEAISLFSRALQQNPKDAAARAGLGLAYEAKGWLAEATTQFEQAAKAAEETATQARFNLGLIAFKQNKFEEALGHFNSVLSKNSTHSEAKRYAELTVQQLHHALGRPDPNLGRKKSD